MVEAASSAPRKPVIRRLSADAVLVHRTRPRPCQYRINPSRHRVRIRSLPGFVADRFDSPQVLKEVSGKMRGPQYEPLVDQMPSAVLDLGRLLELHMHIHPNFRPIRRNGVF